MKQTLLAVLALVLSINLNQAQSNDVKSEKKEIAKPKVTFVELGSVNCIPCKAMQPVMKSIEEKYGEQVKVVFYDVWTKDQR